MEVTDLTSTLEPLFWERVNRDIHHYHFFAFDWKNHKDKTKILLAIENHQISGMMLVYDGRIVQFRGKPEATKILLENLDLETVELQSPLSHKLQVLKNYRPTVSHEMILMLLHRGGENLCSDHKAVKLDQSDAELIASIMKMADPEIWGAVTEQRIVERMDNWAWRGIKFEGTLVSVGSSLLTEWGGHIGVVATRKEYRNKGYATSIVSELAKFILQKNSTAMIHVLKMNYPAVRVYRKVGFRPYRTYFFMKGEKRVST